MKRREQLVTEPLPTFADFRRDYNSPFREKSEEERAADYIKDQKRKPATSPECDKRPSGAGT
jgi:hypothetical protein